MESHESKLESKIPKSNKFDTLKPTEAFREERRLKYIVELIRMTRGWGRDKLLNILLAFSVRLAQRSERVSSKLKKSSLVN